MEISDFLSTSLPSVAHRFINSRGSEADSTCSTRVCFRAHVGKIDPVGSNSLEGGFPSLQDSLPLYARAQVAKYEDARLFVHLRN